MRKRSWHSKGSSNLKHIQKDDQNQPGNKVSTDQIVVAQPGLVPRLSGRLAHDRISGATCFVDHYSGYSFSALQTSLDGEQTMENRQWQQNIRLSLMRIPAVLRYNHMERTVEDLQSVGFVKQSKRHNIP